MHINIILHSLSNVCGYLHVESVSKPLLGIYCRNNVDTLQLNSTLYSRSTHFRLIPKCFYNGCLWGSSFTVQSEFSFESMTNYLIIHNHYKTIYGPVISECSFCRVFKGDRLQQIYRNPSRFDASHSAGLIRNPVKPHQLPLHWRGFVPEAPLL